MNHLTKPSNYLIKMLLENKCVSNYARNKKTNHIVKILYNEIKTADGYIEQLKKQKGLNFYNLKIREIISKKEIPKPKLFNSLSFPQGILNKIDNSINYDLLYSFSLFGREINIYFLLENEIITKNDINIYNSYVDKIMVLLYIIKNYSFKKCSNKLTIYIYLTDLKKELPKTRIDVISSINANTGFTYTCLPVNEIVIFRKEEWFKVLIHETFHNFGLDFSSMNIELYNEKIKTIFKVNSEVNLYEAYTETWAIILNCVFCSYFVNSTNSLEHIFHKTKYYDFVKRFDLFINLEISFGFLQIVKILNFMGLKYIQLYDNDNDLENKRKILYKENTNILAYFIIKEVLLNNYQGFLEWCSKNNFSLINFNKTNKTLEEFYVLIENNYKSTTMLNGIECFELFLKNNKNNKLMKNLRFSVCELE